MRRGREKRAGGEGFRDHTREGILKLERLLWFWTSVGWRIVPALTEETKGSIAAVDGNPDARKAA